MLVRWENDMEYFVHAFCVSVGATKSFGWGELQWRIALSYPDYNSIPLEGQNLQRPIAFAIIHTNIFLTSSPESA